MYLLSLCMMIYQEWPVSADLPLSTRGGGGGGVLFTCPVNNSRPVTLLLIFITLGWTEAHDGDVGGFVFCYLTAKLRVCICTAPSKTTTWANKAQPDERERERERRKLFFCLLRQGLSAQRCTWTHSAHLYNQWNLQTASKRMQHISVGTLRLECL